MPELVPQSRIVFTSMLIAGWRPNTPWLAFMATIAIADGGDDTPYVVTVTHPDQGTRDRREEMGFFDGWHTCIDQLSDFAMTLHPRDGDR
ncbi:SRPBCC domain-containing protein [Variovorax sp. LT1R16]|uniref:SRPBCC domain-containing protein n=1 Tax=Variovorax sp. LT1R16 TaxID=3443728 RepID=UPI003F453FD4